MARNLPPASRTRQAVRGFTLLELMIVVVVATLLATLAIPAYNGYVDEARVASAIGDIGQIQLEIDRFRLNNNGRLPNSLADIGLAGKRDPYGRVYVYLNIEALGPERGPVRKDRNLNPLNSDYDLYSTGDDGESRTPLTARASQDDILRANNGAYLGLAKDY